MSPTWTSRPIAKSFAILWISWINWTGSPFFWLTAQSSPNLNSNSNSSDLFFFKTLGNADSGRGSLEVKVSAPPPLVPQRPWLIEYFAISPGMSTALFF